MKRAHLSAHAHATAWIQRAERLVEQQNRWPRRERTRDGDELPLAAREGAYGSSQQRVCPDARRGFTRDFGRRRTVGDVLVDTQVWEEIAVLVHEAHLPRFGRTAARITSIKADRSRTQRQNARDRLQQRRLAGAGRPNDDAVLSAGNGE